MIEYIDKMSGSLWPNQIASRNFLSPIGFKFSLVKKPKVDFFCNAANLPGLNLGVAIQSNPLKPIPVPGETLSYDDLTLRFMVDEDMVNYLEVYNWLVQFGFPDNFGQYQQLLDEDENSNGKQSAISGMSDGTMFIYTNNFNPNLKINFKDLFPVSLSGISFDSTQNEVNYVTAEVTFKYTIFDIVKL
jgi:hypothetical protein